MFGSRVNLSYNNMTVVVVVNDIYDDSIVYYISSRLLFITWNWNKISIVIESDDPIIRCRKDYWGYS